jgi:hypothetical protein
MNCRKGLYPVFFGLRLSRAIAMSEEEDTEWEEEDFEEDEEEDWGFEEEEW